MHVSFLYAPVYVCLRLGLRVCVYTKTRTYNIDTTWVVPSTLVMKWSMWSRSVPVVQLAEVGKDPK